MAPAGIDFCGSAFVYDVGVKSVVLAAKRSQQHALTRWMSRAIVQRLTEGQADVRTYDALTWPPTTPDRVRARGFDHGELLARNVAVMLGIPAKRLLSRRSASSSRRNAQGRTGVSFVPIVPWTSAVPSRVLLIDDVRTTGSTLGAAAQALRQAGTARVGAFTFAVKE